jgi:GTPase SAR1 family protein
VSVLVLTGLAGSGKTTLATLLCWDDKVRGNTHNITLYLHFLFLLKVCIYVCQDCVRCLYMRRCLIKLLPN